MKLCVNILWNVSEFQLWSLEASVIMSVMEYNNYGAYNAYQPYSSYTGYSSQPNHFNLKVGYNLFLVYLFRLAVLLD